MRCSCNPSPQKIDSIWKIHSSSPAFATTVPLLSAALLFLCAILPCRFKRLFSLSKRAGNPFFYEREHDSLRRLIEESTFGTTDWKECQSKERDRGSLLHVPRSSCRRRRIINYCEPNFFCNNPWPVLLFANSNHFQNRSVHSGEHSPAAHPKPSIQYLQRLTLWSGINGREENSYWSKI